MIVTAIGVTEAPNNFSTQAECEKVSSRIANTYCVEKKQIHVESEMKSFMQMFQRMRKEMENDS